MASGASWRLPRRRRRRRRSGRRPSRRRRLPSGGDTAGTDAYALALGALARKEWTEAELAGWLRERGVEEADLAAALERLLEGALLDDERFAQRFAEDKRELRDWGPERIAEALRRRGVDEALIETALAAEPVERLTERAVGLLVRSGAEVGDDASRTRALALLARRGYPLEAAYDAVRELERNG